MHPENAFLTVSELNDLIRGVINMGFPRSVWVCGEIQGYNRNKDKRHIFFDLCEKNADTKDITARIGLVIFGGRKSYIHEILKSAENAFQLKDDIEVKFLCKVDFYPPHGEMRLIVESIDPIYTLGKIAQQKQKLIAQLEKKGILEKNKQISFPLVPLNIGLITAYDSAAYNDFLSELRMSGFYFKVFFQNALMQGKGAEPDVCRALDRLNSMQQLDAIVITRGGGSIADLSWFDSEKIAQGIAASRLPVLSGIGHEINITITDMAAHTYQKTPTAIARFLVASVEDFLTTMEEKVSTILDYARSKIENENQRLKMAAMDLQNNTTDFLKIHNQHMIRLAEIIKRQPPRLLHEEIREISGRRDILRKTLSLKIKNAQTKILHCERIIKFASPGNTLKRGFSITRTKEGQLLRSIKKTRPKETLTTHLYDGSIQSQVNTIKAGNP